MSPMEKKSRSLGISDGDDSSSLEPLLIEESSPLSFERPQRRPICAIVLFICSFLMFLLSAILWYKISVGAHGLHQCIRQTSAYSPLIDTVKLSSFNFNNSFTHKSIYRGPPTDALERAWERLWNHDLIAIPEENFPHLNKSTKETYMRVPVSQGGGYAANIEVFHQLHCLNMIRQFTWLDYYPKHPERVSTPHDLAIADEIGRRIHVDHCIEALRLSLMCHADVTPFLYLENQEGDDEHLGASDFNANHKCRNFDEIKDAFLERTVMQRWPGGNRQWTVGEDRR